MGLECKSELLTTSENSGNPEDLKNILIVEAGKSRGNPLQILQATIRRATQEAGYDANNKNEILHAIKAIIEGSDNAFLLDFVIQALRNRESLKEALAGVVDISILIPDETQPVFDPYLF
jgi:hypothetical protein